MIKNHKTNPWKTRIVPGFMILCLVLCSTLVTGGGERLFRFQESPSPDAEVTIRVDKLSHYTVSGRLFGKFTENIVTNVYGGFWGQILDNPSLEPISVCLSAKSIRRSERVGLKRLTHKNLPDQYDEKNVAYKWYRWNKKHTAPRFSKHAFNTSLSQLIKVSRIPPEIKGAGIRQPVFLPLHRESSYRVRLFVKGATAPLIALVTDIREKEILGKIRFDPRETSDWVPLEGILTLEGSIKYQAKPLWFCIGLEEEGEVKIDQLTLFPIDAVDGFDPDVIELAKKQRIRILRFPGGNYVSGYHWKDDLTSLDKRPTKRNPAWFQYDPHHVGTDEHIRLCRLIGAEPMICVNAGNGTPREAADWVEYCNGSPETQWGGVRANRGHPEPYNVKVWEVGNELWGDWQIGHCSSEEYARRYRAFYNAMKAADPSIHIIATGNPSGALPEWNDVLIRECPDILHSLTLHFLCTNSPQSPPEFAFLSQMGYSWFFEKAFFRKIHSKARERGLDLKIAITEEMIFNHRAYHPRPETMAEALFYAGTLCSAIRTEGIVEIFTHSALINHGGNMRKERGRVWGEPVYYAFQELQKLAGTRPAAFSLSCPFSDVPEWMDWGGTAPEKFPLLDVMPLVGNGDLAVIVSNRSPDQAVPLAIRIRGANFENGIELFELAGNSFMARNDLLHPERVYPSVEKIREKDPGSFQIITPPASLSILTLKQRP